jgi:threonine dehydrogenase-like Zn-dependent dehydrogenase
VRCLGVIPGTRRVDVVERPEPELPGEGQVLVEMVECGVCGTDRHIIEGGRPRPEPGQVALVLGHEPLGRVLRAGPGVGHLREGDYVTATNQRSCGCCDPCARGEVDLCLTAAGAGRGVGGMDGFLRPRLLDDAAFCVSVPGDLASVAVLTEPLAVGEKAIEQMRQVQRRLPGSPWTEQAADDGWARGLRFAVGGAGPIGMLVALALRCHGAEVHVCDRAPEDGVKAGLVAALGARYHHSAEMEDAGRWAAALGHIDGAFEATGSAEVLVALWRALGRNGALAMIGGGRGPAEPVHPGRLLGQALGRNQALFGTVASNTRHFRAALADLGLARQRFPAAVERIVTARHRFDDAAQAFEAAGVDDVKAVIRVEGA